MSVHLKSLKIFCDVVRQRSFSKAADENGISQSGASQVIHQLETNLNVKLIDRSKRPFVLTPEGEVYYDGCRAVVDRYFALEDKVKTLHQEVVGRVRVASIYSVGLHHMNQYVRQFLSDHPKANVRLEYLHPNRVYEAVEGDLADIGLVSYPKPSRNIQVIDWRKERMVVVCHPAHPLAQQQRVALSELHGAKMISFDQDLSIRSEIDRVLERYQVEVSIAMEFDNIETIKRAIEIDAGIGLLPEPTVVREVRAGTLAAVRLEHDELIRPLGIIYRRGKDLSGTAQRFIELLQREAGAAREVTTIEEPAFAQGNGRRSDGPHDTLALNSVSGSVSGNGNGNGNGSHGNGRAPAAAERPATEPNVW